MTARIMELARALGQLDGGNETALEALCAGAEQEVRGWLKPGVAPEDCESAFLLAAAWVALAGRTAGDAGEVEQFAAGEVSIRRQGGDGAQRAAALRLQARQVLRPYLRDGGFAFQGVRG